MTRPASSLAACIATLCLSAPVAAQSLWTVDNKPCVGADFQQIQPAIDAAADGDVIWVRLTAPGVVTPFVVDGKALTIVADGSLKVGGPGTAVTTIENLSAGQDTRLLGIPNLEGLLVRDCAGAVWVDGCRIDAEFSGAHAEVRDSDAVAFSNCDFGGITLGNGFSGIDVYGSTVMVIGSSVSGQDGGLGSGYRGGYGIALAPGSELLIADSIVAGGEGGVFYDSFGYGVAMAGGVLALGAPFASVPLGVFAGPTTLVARLPDDGLVDPGSARTVTLQALSLTAGGEVVAPASMLVLLDQGFASTLGCD
ncbi:MAG: right-handed parallel beta-helix repeat-containing protein [Planctomycetota bacterium]|jgi:hypothetical protein